MEASFEQFRQACRQGHVEKAMDLFAQYGDTYPDTSLIEVFRQASKDGLREMVAMLIPRMTPYALATRNACMKCVRNGDVDMVKIFSKSRQFDQEEEQRMVNCAIKHGKIEVLAFLLAKEGDPQRKEVAMRAAGYQACMNSISSGDAKAVGDFCATYEFNHEQKSALATKAVRDGQTQSMEALLSGADKKLVHVALRTACEENNIQALDLILERFRITPSIQIQGFLLACEASALGALGKLIDRYESNARMLCEELASNPTRKQAHQVLCAALEQRELDMSAPQPSSPRPSTARRI